MRGLAILSGAAPSAACVLLAAACATASAGRGLQPAPSPPCFGATLPEGTEIGFAGDRPWISGSGPVELAGEKYFRMGPARPAGRLRSAVAFRGLHDGVPVYVPAEQQQLDPPVLLIFPLDPTCRYVEFLHISNVRITGP